MAGPIWESIRTTLSREISDGTFPPGAQLPTESELAARFAVNRHTVRRALGAMRDDGLVRSRRGAGVFVIATPIDYRLGSRTRFTQLLEAEGHASQRLVLRLDTVPATDREAELLQIPTGAMVVLQETVGLADGARLTYSRGVFPVDRLDGIEEALRHSNGSATTALRTCGVPDYRRAWTRIAAKRASAATARHLEVSDGAPLIRTRSLNVAADGTPVELGQTYFCADRVELLVEPDTEA
ncbi:MAG: phosphonate metabolism transcriptional regulator PhnF [Pseudomonadota bacterium]